MASMSHFDYEAMRAVARRLAQRNAELDVGLQQVEEVARIFGERCRSLEEREGARFTHLLQ